LREGARLKARALAGEKGVIRMVTASSAGMGSGLYGAIAIS